MENEERSAVEQTYDHIIELKKASFTWESIWRGNIMDDTRMTEGTLSEKVERLHNFIDRFDQELAKKNTLLAADWIEDVSLQASIILKELDDLSNEIKEEVE